MFNSKSKTLIAIAFAAALAGCSTTDQNSAVVGGATGAVIGGATTGTLGGAAVGTAIGAGAGVLIGRLLNSDQCRYRNRRGQVYIARCR